MFRRLLRALGRAARSGLPLSVGVMFVHDEVETGHGEPICVIPHSSDTFVCCRCHAPFAAGDPYVLAELTSEGPNFEVICLDCGAVDAFPELAG